MSAKKPRIKWNVNLELSLLDIWEAKLNDLRKQKRNSHVYSEIAELLKSSSAYDLDGNIDGNDIKNKICNLTQRYRNEKKAVGPSGGSPSTWIHFEKIHSMLGALPCNDLSLMNESFDYASLKKQFQLNDDDVLLYVEDDPEEESSNKAEFTEAHDVEATDSSNPTSLPSTSVSSSSTSTFPVATRTTKALKRKIQSDIDKELLQQIKRSNDLAEKDLLENTRLREQQMEVLKVIGTTTTALLEYLQSKTKM